jgi:hypothetical protein
VVYSTYALINKYNNRENTIKKYRYPTYVGLYIFSDNKIIKIDIIKRFYVFYIQEWHIDCVRLKNSKIL